MKNTGILLAGLLVGATGGQLVSGQLASQPTGTAEIRYVQSSTVITAEQAIAGELDRHLEEIICVAANSAMGLSGDKECSMVRYVTAGPHGQPAVVFLRQSGGSYLVNATLAMPVVNAKGATGVRYTQVSIKIPAEQAGVLDSHLAEIVCPDVNARFHLSGSNECSMDRYLTAGDHGQPSTVFMRHADGGYLVNSTLAMPLIATVVEND